MQCCLDTAVNCIESQCKSTRIKLYHNGLNYASSVNGILDHPPSKFTNCNGRNILVKAIVSNCHVPLSFTSSLHDSWRSSYHYIVLQYAVGLLQMMPLSWLAFPSQPLLLTKCEGPLPVAIWPHTAAKFIPQYWPLVILEIVEVMGNEKCLLQPV